jgi:hypothetical protein
MEKYLRYQLERQLYGNFNLKNALTLSDLIHKYESEGFEISDELDRLWLKLTVKIEKARA